MIEDFGFTFEPDDKEARALAAEQKKQTDDKMSSLQKTIDQQYETNRTMFRKIMVLLTNLKKNPESAKIHWPNRAEAIDKFIKELEELKIKKDSNG